MKPHLTKFTRHLWRCVLPVGACVPGIGRTPEAAWVSFVECNAGRFRGLH